MTETYDLSAVEQNTICKLSTQHRTTVQTGHTLTPIESGDFNLEFDIDSTPLGLCCVTGDNVNG